ncbi:MAG: hypothetical protein A2W29_12460 [Gemmatimonadetes bacterium RBG_16_66_8]|nr:MAG: hypothetical protein A2W29_12460 [Gemmatimonadetes bacterium RBG_16_66_8]
MHDGHQWDIVAWPAGDPGGARSITADDPLDADPRWTEDGADLLFTSERLGLPQVFAWRRADGATRQLSNEPAGARDGSVTPDGGLVYAATLADGYAVVGRSLMEVAQGTPDIGDLLMPASPRAAATAPVSTRRTGYAPWPSLRPHFWLPTWHDAGTAGRFGGAVIAGADAVGRTAYLVQLGVAPDRPRIEGVVDLNYSRWKAASVDASYEATWSPRLGVVQQTGDTVPLALIEELAATGLTLRWRRWRSAISLRVGGELEFETLVNDSPLSLQLGTRPDYVNGVISLSAYHATQPPLAISLEDGVSVGLRYRRRAQLGGSGWSEEWRGAVNAYVALPLPGFAHWVLAGRVAGGVSSGPNRASFDLGGESGDLVALLPGYAVGSGRRQFALRGYD